MDTILLVLVAVSLLMHGVRLVAPLTKTKADDAVVKAIDLVEPWVLAELTRRISEALLVKASAAAPTDAK